MDFAKPIIEVIVLTKPKENHQPSQSTFFKCAIKPKNEQPTGACNFQRIESMEWRISNKDILKNKQ